jgi:hypothetical protein
MNLDFIFLGMAEENPCHYVLSLLGCITVFYLLRA